MTRKVHIVAVPETSGSALYGMVDVLSATGRVWQQLTGQGDPSPAFEPVIVSPRRRGFHCGFGIPVQPAMTPAQAADARLIILPELWLGPDEHWGGRYPDLLRWLRERHGDGAHLYSACSGAVMLAATGLLDGRNATSHWGYRELFRRDFPRVRFQPEPSLCLADEDGRMVTAGGTTSWHDLALYIIARHCSPAEASRIARVYLLKWHDEGQLPYTPLSASRPHADTLVRDCETWLRDHFSEPGLIQTVVARSGLPERTLKRRFRQCTGLSLIDYIHNLRVEHARTLLETTRYGVDVICGEVGYAEPAFFRRLFKRLTGVTPAGYRRLFHHWSQPAPTNSRRGVMSDAR